MSGLAGTVERKDKWPVLAMRRKEDDWRKEEKEGVAEVFNSSWSNN